MLKENIVKRLSPIFLSVFTLSSCEVVISETQIIEIDLYDDLDKNNKIVEAITGYEPSYITRNIPSFTSDMAQSIKLGFIRLSSDNKSKYKIDYRTDNPAVAEKLDNPTEEFASYIPKLAQLHSEKLNTFDELKPSAVDIFTQLWEGSISSVWEEGSSLLKSTASKEDLVTALQVWIRNYQKPVEFSYISSQYYMPVENIPESVSIFHKVKFENDEIAVFRISLQKEAKGWYFMGINFTPEKRKELI